MSDTLPHRKVPQHVPLEQDLCAQDRVVLRTAVLKGAIAPVLGEPPDIVKEGDDLGRAVARASSPSPAAMLQGVVADVAGVLLLEQDVLLVLRVRLGVLLHEAGRSGPRGCDDSWSMTLLTMYHIFALVRKEKGPAAPARAADPID